MRGGHARRGLRRARIRRVLRRIPGWTLTCVDVDRSRIDRPSRGRDAHSTSQGSKPWSHATRPGGRLRFTVGPGSEVGAADLVFIAVGTPRAARGTAMPICATCTGTARRLAPYLRGVYGHRHEVHGARRAPPGSSGRLVKEVRPEADFDVASNPEFSGRVPRSRISCAPTRVVIGVESARAEALLQRAVPPAQPHRDADRRRPDWRAPSSPSTRPTPFSRRRSASSTRFAALCEASGADVHAVARGMGLDGRIGRKFLHPGPRLRRLLLPKDTAALARIAAERGVPARIVEAVIKANAAQRVRMTEKVRAALDGNVAGKRIGVLGLTFKPETDDVREAPSLPRSAASRRGGSVRPGARSGTAWTRPQGTSRPGCGSARTLTSGRSRGRGGCS